MNLTRKVALVLKLTEFKPFEHYARLITGRIHTMKITLMSPISTNYMKRLSCYHSTYKRLRT